MESWDAVIVGGGIVGLATAHALIQAKPQWRICVLEKEGSVAEHQSSRNSGVIHSGIYYPPNSHKALLCRWGKSLLERFCEEEGVETQRCGKLIVAREKAELSRLLALLDRGRLNGVECRQIDEHELREMEANVQGIGAIWIPETGLIDYGEFTRVLAIRLERAGVQISRNTQALRIWTNRGSVGVETLQGSLRTRYAVNCAGLYSDRIARRSGMAMKARIIPFRGEYYELRESARHLCRSLIYPLPDPRFPFLGVHLSPTLDGRVLCGPNAMVSFAREGYRRSDMNFRDLWETLSYPGFLRFAIRHGGSGIREAWRAFSKRSFLRSVQTLVPAVKLDDLIPAPSGVRAQSMTWDGQLVEDFWVEQDGPVFHICNAPSPAATSSLAIGEHISSLLLKYHGTA